MKVGIDTIEIERIKPSVEFLEKILTPNEMDYINKFTDIRERVAGFFCAKEAIFKALDMNILDHQEIEISHQENGRPIVSLYGKTLDYFKKNYVEIDVSISHSKTIATAICIIQ